jgi:SAM-dependent methyltransferase
VSVTVGEPRTPARVIARTRSARRYARRSVSTSLVDRLRAASASSAGSGPSLTLDETIVTAFPGGELDAGRSKDRYRRWRERQGPRSPEYLLPRIVRQIDPVAPGFLGRPSRDITVDALRAELTRLAPWYVPFELPGAVNTMEYTDRFGAKIFREGNAERMRFRTELITGTIALLLGDELPNTEVLDIGCNSGWFTFDIADRGARSVTGVDLRAHNIEQARFLGDYFGFENTHFDVADATAFDDPRRWDVVMNLGVLYHVTDPLQFMQRTYELCRQFAVLDTICHDEPFSGFVLLDTKDASHPHEGREEWEMHPTYRGAIDALKYAGFSEIVEVVPATDAETGLYQSGSRRCFVAVK